jgi:hypothetical protein
MYKIHNALSLSSSWAREESESIIKIQKTCAWNKLTETCDTKIYFLIARSHELTKNVGKRNDSMVVLKNLIGGVNFLWSWEIGLTHKRMGIDWTSGWVLKRWDLKDNEWNKKQINFINFFEGMKTFPKKKKCKIYLEI